MKKIIWFFILIISLCYRTIEASSTIEIKDVSVSGKEVIVTTLAKIEQIPNTKKTVEIVTIIFDSSKNKIEEKNVLNTSKDTGLGSVVYSGLKPETEYFFRVYMKEIIPKKIGADEIKLIHNSAGFVSFKTGLFDQKNFTKTETNEVVDVSSKKIGGTDHKTKYNLLAPILGIKCIDTDTINGDKSCLSGGIGEYLNLIFKILIGLCAALAVIMLIINGVTYMGDESVFGKTEAKHKMFSAIIGLIIALASYAILNTINPDLTGKKGVNVDQINIEVESASQYKLALTQDSPEAKIFKRTSYYNQIKTAAEKNNIPHCLIQVAIQRESGGVSSIGHDEDVPSVNVPSRRNFIASGKMFNGTTFTPGNTKDPRITQSSFKNTDHPSSYTKPMDLTKNDLGLDWRFSHSVGMFGVTFGPNHIDPSGAKNIYTNSNEDINRAINIMKSFYGKCGKNIEKTWRAYNSGSCTGNNNFTNKETSIRVNLYNQCLKQDN